MHCRFKKYSQLQNFRNVSSVMWLLLCLLLVGFLLHLPWQNFGDTCLHLSQEHPMNCVNSKLRNCVKEKKESKLILNTIDVLSETTRKFQNCNRIIVRYSQGRIGVNLFALLPYVYSSKSNWVLLPWLPTSSELFFYYRAFF